MLSESTLRTLFDLSFQFKKQKIWTLLSDTHIFAVQLSGGEIGYCSITGQAGQHASLNVYIGQEGFSSFQTVLQNHSFTPDDHGFRASILLSHDCLQVAYEDEDIVSPEQMAQARDYARLLHVSLTSPFRYPHFDRYIPLQRPEPVSDETDAAILIEVLHAALFLADCLLNGKPLGVEYGMFFGKPIPVPFFTPSESGYTISTTMLPEYKKPSLAPMPLIDQVTLTRLRQCKATGTWDCAIALLLSTVVGDQDPCFVPSLPVLFKPQTGTLVPAPALGSIQSESDRMFREMVQAIIQAGERPSKIRVHQLDYPGQSFFGALAQQLHIPLSIEASLPGLNEAILHMTEDFRTPGGGPDGPDNVDKLIGIVCRLLEVAPVSQLRAAPPDFQIVAKLLLFTNYPTVTDTARQKIQQCIKYWP